MDRRDRIVVAQGLALAALAWPGHARWPLPWPARVVGGMLLAVGGGFSLAAARSHGRHLTPRVEPHQQAHLLEHGPYAVARHPIYTGLLGATAGWAVLRRRAEPAVAWIALLTILTVKSSREEERLEARFGSRYASYRARTPRFLGPRHR